jgi:hypothetical protein
MKKKPKRPRDPIALAKLVGDIATGRAVDEKAKKQRPVKTVSKKSR